MAYGLVVTVFVAARFVTGSPLWLDEALTVNIASLPLGDITEALRRDGHPILYYALLHGWIQLFGDGDAAVRALSGVVSTACLPFAWLIGRRMGGRLLGWSAVLVLAIGPFGIRYATEARMYALVMLLVLAGWLLVDDALERPTLPRLAGIAVLGALVLYSHYWGLFLLGAVGLLLLERARRSDGARRQAALRCAGALIASGVLFLPWIGVLLYQSANTGTPWARMSRPTAVLGITIQDWGGGGYPEAVALGALFVALGLLAAFGVTAVDGRVELLATVQPQTRRELSVVGLTMTIAIVVALATNSAFESRYTAVVYPLAMLVVAAGVSRLASPAARAAVLAPVVLLAAVGVGWNMTRDRSQAEVVATAINEQAQPGDVVLLCPDQLGPATTRYLRDDVDAIRYPDLGDPRFVDWVDYSARNEASDPAAVARQAIDRAGSDHAVFLVWMGTYRTLERQCTDLNAALGALRPGGPVVAADGGNYFEAMNLARYPAPT